jgi:hypothetical protein
LESFATGSRLAAMSHQEDSRALITVAIPPVDQEWRTILQAQNQVVLYNATSHALSIRPSAVHQDHLPDTSLCPYCNRPLPVDEGGGDTQDRAANYFQLLEVSNEAFSRPSTPPVIEPMSPAAESSTFAAETMAQGYFHAFFEEECRLGIGANGSVFLCQVCLKQPRPMAPSHIDHISSMSWTGIVLVRCTDICLQLLQE